MKKTIIIGSGGHCRAILSVLETLKNPIPFAIYDISTPKEGELIYNIPVFKIPSDQEFLKNKDDYNYILSIGDNNTRQKFFNKLKKLDCEIKSVISPLATVSNKVYLGEGVCVLPNSFIGPEVIINDNTIINTSCIVEHEAVIGKHSHLAPGSIICGRSIIEDSCFIGANTTIIEKILISSRNTIGAGSVVISSIKTIGGKWVGNPAKQINL